MASKLLTAMLSAELPNATSATGAPKEFRILRAGLNKTKQGDAVFSERSAKLVLEKQDENGHLVLIDYRHQAHKPDPADPIQAGKAAGWCKLAVRGGELWATEVDWSPTAKQMLESKEYRYYSPVIDVERDSREVVELQSLGLTNRPATKHITALLEDVIVDDRDEAATTPPASPEPPTMKNVLLQLGLEATATEGDAVSKLAQMQLEQQQLLTLTGAKSLPVAVASAAAWKTAADKLPALEKQVLQLEQEKATQEKTLILEQGKKDGKIPPALEPFLMNLPLEAVKEYVAKAPKASPASAGLKEGAQTSPGTEELTLEEKKAAKLAGVTEESIKAAKEKRRLESIGA